MPRYAPKMTSADLRQMIIDKAIQNDYLEDYGDLDQANPDMTRVIDMLLMEGLATDIEKDWSKIDFSTENTDIIAEKVTSEGVPYIEMRAGGDWETPLICIIYFDGKKLRGYVPKDGNTYNHKAKAAFGNNDDDNDACIKQFGDRGGTDEEYRDVEPDLSLIDVEIAQRIEAKGTYSYIQKPVVSKAKIKADKQAKIEKGQDLTGPITADKVYAVISLAAGCSYVTFKLRSSGRKLTVDEANRLVGVPAVLEKSVPSYSDEVLWYAPMGGYPKWMLATLEAAGFVKAPDNDISMYDDARTEVIFLR